MAQNVNLTDDQQAKLGEEVARLKALLNEVENKISNHDTNSVDWGDVSAKLRSLDAKVGELSGNVVTREAIPPPENKDNLASVETTGKESRLTPSEASGPPDDESEDDFDSDTAPPVDDKY